MRVLRSLIRNGMEKAGMFYTRRTSMPRGIDWLWDIQRIVGTDRIKTVFDVGANVGQTVIKMKKAFHVANIFAFEPVSSTFAALQQNTQMFNGVRTYPLALSDTLCKGMMISEKDSQLSHLADSAAVQKLSKPPLEEVEIVTLDHFCDEKGIDRIDILKIDTEGSDLAVLKGSTRMLRSGKVDFVYCEVCFDPSDTAHSHFALIESFLTDCGFRFNCLYEYGHNDYGVHLIFCNALFVSNSLRDRTR